MAYGNSNDDKKNGNGKKKMPPKKKGKSKLPHGSADEMIADVMGGASAERLVEIQVVAFSVTQAPQEFMQWYSGRQGTYPTMEAAFDSWWGEYMTPDYDDHRDLVLQHVRSYGA